MADTNVDPQFVNFPSVEVVAGLVAVALAAGCAGKQAEPPEAGSVPEESPSLVNIQPRDGVFLRSGFDADPSPFVGRFINNNVSQEEIDETKAVQTRCSKHIKAETVDAGGSFEEYLNASRGASASANVKSGALPEEALGDASPSGDIAAKLSRGTVVRVKYDLKKKMRGTKTEDYYECCRKHVNACSGRYLAEFWRGTGKVYQAVDTQQSAEANASAPTKGSASIEYKNGIAWKRAMTFDDLYFAFRTARAKIQKAGCQWANQPPTSEKGEYFVGVSPPAASKSAARDRAMRNARKQAVQFLGQYVSSSTNTKSSTVEGYLKDENFVRTVAEGIAKHVKDQRWCPVKTKKSPDGKLFVSKVLAFFPNESKKAAAQQFMDRVDEKASGGETKSGSQSTSDGNGESTDESGTAADGPDETDEESE